MADLIEENLREYVLCFPTSIGSHPALDTYYIEKTGLFNEIQKEFDNLASVRDKLSFISKFRETDSTNELKGAEGLTGIVIEFGVTDGVDAFAAYSDGVAAWYDSSKPKLTEVVLTGDSKVKIENILNHAKKITEVAELSENIPSPPHAGFALVSLIDASGIRFGLGTSRDMAMNNISGPVIKDALLMRKLILSL